MGVCEQTEAILKILGQIRSVYFRDEYAIQKRIAELLTANDVQFQAEYPLDKRNRVDFLAGGVLIEVKAGKPNSHRLANQVERYAQFPEVEAVVIVVERNVFHVPSCVNGKPVHYVSLSSNWGVAF